MIINNNNTKCVLSLCDFMMLRLKHQLLRNICRQTCLFFNVLILFLHTY